VPRWSASGQRFRKRCQSQRDNESAILFEIPEISNLWEEMDILKDITFLELFPVVVALCSWGEQLKNKKIIFNIDNQSVCLWTKVPETLPITTR
jgi:hypothetical protein